MAESTASLSYEDFRREVGIFLNLGGDPANWTDATAQRIDQIIANGLRTFYTPPPVMIRGQPVSHRWRFLRPLAVLATVGGQEDYDLPDDFAYFEGRMTYASTQTGGGIEHTSEEAIRLLRQRGTSSGMPSLAAVTPTANEAGIAGQRWTLMLWPTPGGVYNLSYRYHRLPRKLTEARPIPLGGEIHAQTMLEFCLWQAELAFDDNNQGVHRAQALELLVSAIEMDRNTGPQNLGVMTEPGASGGGGRRGRAEYDHTVTYNGVPY